VESGKALEVPDLQLEGRGQVVITSADATQFALEDGELNGKPPTSHFVRALTDGLETGKADRHPQDGLITIDELMSYLVRRLKILGSPQRPTKWTFGTVCSGVLFARNPRGNAAARFNRLSEDDLKKKVDLYFSKGDSRSMVSVLESAAANGSISAAEQLGSLLTYTSSVRDYAKGREWYEKAASDGSIYAMLSLSRIYMEGRGVDQDYEKARECMKTPPTRAARLLCSRWLSYTCTA
jgi:hypothetical protein